jgi:hypothetical protein
MTNAASLKPEKTATSVEVTQLTTRDFKGAFLISSPFQCFILLLVNLSYSYTYYLRHRGPLAFPGTLI